MELELDLLPLTTSGSNKSMLRVHIILPFKTSSWSVMDEYYTSFLRRTNFLLFTASWSLE